MAPTCVAFDAERRLFVADSTLQNVLTLGRDDVWAPVLRRADAADRPLDEVRCMIPAPGGGVYVAETYGYTIRLLRAPFDAQVIAGNGEEGFTEDGEDLRRGRIGAVAAMITDAEGRLVLFDGAHLLLRRLTAGGVVETIGGTSRMEPTPDGLTLQETALAEITGLARDRRGRLIYCDRGLAVVRVVDEQGRVHALWRDPPGGRPCEPARIACDRGERLYVLDTASERVLQVDLEVDPPAVTTWFDARKQSDDAEILGLRDIAVDAAWGVIAVDARGARIVRLLPDGAVAALPAAVRVA